MILNHRWLHPVIPGFWKIKTGIFGFYKQGGCVQKVTKSYLLKCDTKCSSIFIKLFYAIVIGKNSGFDTTIIFASIKEICGYKLHAFSNVISLMLKWLKLLSQSLSHFTQPFLAKIKAFRFLAFEDFAYKMPCICFLYFFKMK